MYNFLDSVNKINNFKDINDKFSPSIPKDIKSDTYVTGTILLIQINNDTLSKFNLNDKKPYMIFLNEISRIVKCNENFIDISYTPDMIQVIFSTPKKVQVDSVIDDVGRISSLCRLINSNFNNKIGITMSVDYGQLVVQEFMGDHIWYGLPLLSAKSLLQNKDGYVFISNIIFRNINVNNQHIFKSNEDKYFYTDSIINVYMNNYLISKSLNKYE